MSLRERLPSVLRTRLDVLVDHALEAPEEFEQFGIVATPAGNLIHLSQDDIDHYSEEGHIEETGEFIATSPDVLVSLSEVR